MLYVCGSFRFIHEMNELGQKLREEKIEFQMPKKTDNRGILGCLRKIDKADVVYIVNPGGYIGKSVSIDIGYALARNKPIYVMNQIDDPPIMSLVKGVLSFRELISLFKHGDLTKT